MIVLTKHPMEYFKFLYRDSGSNALVNKGYVYEINNIQIENKVYKFRRQDFKDDPIPVKLVMENLQKYPEATPRYSSNFYIEIKAVKIPKEQSYCVINLKLNETLIWQIFDYEDRRSGCIMKLEPSLKNQ